MRSDVFWRHVDKDQISGCWLWTGATRDDGYGAFRIRGQVHGAHRVAFLLTHGRWPVEAMHVCDWPGCVNPSHIIDGTHARNMREKRRGSKSFAHVPTVAVDALRHWFTRGVSFVDLAAAARMRQRIVRAIVGVPDGRDVR